MGTTRDNARIGLLAGCQGE